ncbi:integral membrane protein [Secundilactobacillus malefermentans DSM 5705 = KCTC 3548]|nr:integral membrane protein [Secundilactobacillus malefermentans DSM 5705 = KCTC 3548]
MKRFELPALVIKFLSFMPITIMTALMFENLLVAKTGHLPLFDWQNVLATIPAVIAAIISKSLLIVVVVGIIAMAVIRYFNFG